MDTIKNTISTSAMLYLSRTDLPFVLYIDASESSDLGIGGALVQEIECC